MRRVWMPVQMTQPCRMCHATPLVLTRQAPFTTAARINEGIDAKGGDDIGSDTGNGGSSGVVAPTSIAPGPYRHVGNIFIVHCEDHPFKHSWEINRMLRELRLEFRGQTTIVPDIPSVRKQLWRVRHVVQVDMLDLDEAKALIGVPEHISFCDLLSQVPASFGRVRAVANPVLRSKMNFMRLRRMRLRDVLHRDALELRLLEEKRKQLIAKQEQGLRGAEEKVKEETSPHSS